MRTFRAHAVVLALVAVAATAAATAVPADGAKRKPPRHRSFVIPKGASVVAHVRKRAVNVYPKRRAKRPKLVLRTKSARRKPIVFLVRWERRRWTWPRWVRVYLPRRPNGSTGWVRARSVRFLLNPYRIRINLRKHRLVVWRRKRVFLRSAVGVGTAMTPTPTGVYFITALVRPPNPRGAFGPYVYRTSAFSTVLKRFAGGPGQVGIHGTNYPRGLGKDVSHGCIRLRNRHIRRLARVLPLGTPIVITQKARPRPKPKPKRPKAKRARGRTIAAWPQRAIVARPNPG